MMSLPMPPNKTRIKMFWLSLGLVVGCVGGFVVLLIHSLYAIPAGIVLFLVIFAVGTVNKELAYAGYKGWNKVIYKYARLARGWMSVIVLCYLMIIGITGSVLKIVTHSKTGSMWIRKGDFGTVEGIPQLVDDTLSEKGWIRTYLQWIRESNNWWAIFLIPFIKLTDAMKSESYVPSIPRNTYTLY